MSKARLVITAVVVQGRSVGEVCLEYGVSRSWLYELLARYRAEGAAAFEPRSRRPKRSTGAVPQEVIAAVLRERDRLVGAGLDGGPETIRWHLEQAGVRVSRASIARILTRHGRVRPEPRKKPRAALRRFAAEQPNECWQSDFTHYRLAGGADVQIICWLDDHARYILHLSAHVPVTGQVVLDTFRSTIAEFGCPASTLTDNGMVYTVRLSAVGVRGGRNAFEVELSQLGVTQKNSRPNHPMTCGKIERFWQTLKSWLRAHPAQPETVAALQSLLDRFRPEYNDTRPHRALDRRTPAAAYQSRPKATPTAAGEPRTGPTTGSATTRSTTPKITLRHAGTLYAIGIGRAYDGTPVVMLVQDRHVTVSHAQTGEILTDLTLDTTRRYQPRHTKQGEP